MSYTEPFLTSIALFESPFSALSNDAILVKNGSVQLILRRLKVQYRTVLISGPHIIAFLSGSFCFCFFVIPRRLLSAENDGV